MYYFCDGASPHSAPEDADLNLDKETWLPVMTKGWNALLSAVEPSGKLGYVQPIGADPKKVNRGMTEVYGVGAFLLVGCEICKMAI